MRRWGVWVGIVIVVALVIGFALVEKPAEKPAEQPSGPPPHAGAALGIPASRPDAANAKVVIEAFFPANERHREEFKLVRGLEDKYPGKVRSEIYDFSRPDDRPEDYAKWKKAGLGCAGIFINGKNTLTVDTGKGPHEVMFQRALAGMWTQEELETAVAAEVKKAYGE